MKLRKKKMITEKYKVTIKKPKDIGKFLGDDFFYHQGSIESWEDIPLEKKESLIEERAKSLIKNEWQRWTPGLGFYRLIKDGFINEDSRILSLIHSNKYNFTNIAINVAEFGGIIYGLTGLLIK